MEWYYADESEKQHIVSAVDLPGLVAASRVRIGTLVWNETMSVWTRAEAALPHLFPVIPPQLSLAQRRAAMTPLAESLSGQKPATDAVAVCALVFGILSLPICLPIFSIPAIICGHIARRRAREETTSSANAGLALGGLITGYIGLASMVLILVIYAGAILFAVATEGTTGGGTAP